jgi:hypothetical protein
MIEQYNNTVTVEPLENMDTTTNNDETTNTMQSNTLNGNSDKITQAVILLLIHLGILLLILGLGSNLLFFVFSTTNLEYQEKLLFDYMFDTECNDDSCTKPNKDIKTAMVGGNNLNKLKEIGKYLKTKDIVETCKKINSEKISQEKNEPTFNSDPSLYQLFWKADKDSDLWLNRKLKNILQILQFTSNISCSLTIFIGIFFYIILIIFTLSPILSIVYTFNNAYNFLNLSFNSNFYKELGIIKIAFGISLYIIFTFFLPIITTRIYFLKSIFLLLQMLLYPLVIDGGISLLKILQNNMFIVKLITIILSISYVSFLSTLVDKTTYIGVLIAFVLIILYTLKNLFT